MSRPAPPTPQSRDLVFCHQCENEWYRDEHGLACPDCQSDFTEIVEADHDPREDDMHIPADDNPTPQHPLHGHNPWDAPDPDEEDIEHFGWQRGGPGQEHTYRRSFNHTIDLGGNGQGQGGGLMGLLGNMLGGLGGAVQQQQREGQNPGGQQQPGGDQGPPQQGGSQTRQFRGSGYTVTMTTGGNLFPRNANRPQPFNNQPDHISQLMQQVVANIGAFPPLDANGMRGGQRPPFPFGAHVHDHDHGHPFAGGAMPFPENLLRLFNGPPGVHGDAVYTQEGLDQIISQLMEQHQSGNAPGPASENAIKSLAKRPIEAKDLDEQGKADCSICMDEVNLGQEVTVLPCGHWFHGDCVKAWLGEHDTCPHCRQGIMPKDAPAEVSRGAREPSQQPLNNQNPWQVPGSFPGAGSGTRDSPFTVPDSPEERARRPGVQSQGSASARVFDRMRNAFGGGDAGGSNNPGGNSGAEGAGGYNRS